MEHEAASGFVVDWRLLTLQAVNFLVLLGLLTWILWKPLVKMMDERRKEIAEGLAAAKLQKEALAKADEERKLLLSDAKTEANRLVADARTQLKAERRTLEEEFRHKKTSLEERIQKERAQLTSEAQAAAQKELGNLVVAAVTKVAQGQDFSVERIAKTVEVTAKEKK